MSWAAMKKFKINELSVDNWIVSHNEFPRFTCSFETKKFHISKTINGLEDPTGNPKEVALLLRMEQWLLKYHKSKIVWIPWSSKKNLPHTPYSANASSSSFLLIFKLNSTMLITTPQINCIVLSRIKCFWGTRKIQFKEVLSVT